MNKFNTSTIPLYRPTAKSLSLCPLYFIIQVFGYRSDKVDTIRYLPRLSLLPSLRLEPGESGFTREDPDRCVLRKVCLGTRSRYHVRYSKGSTVTPVSNPTTLVGVPTRVNDSQLSSSRLPAVASTVQPKKSRTPAVFQQR